MHIPEISQSAPYILTHLISIINKHKRFILFIHTERPRRICAADRELCLKASEKSFTLIAVRARCGLRRVEVSAAEFLVRRVKTGFYRLQPSSKQESEAALD